MRSFIRGVKYYSPVVALIPAIALAVFAFVQLLINQTVSNTAQATNRAFLFFDNATLIPYPPPPNEQKVYAVAVYIENSGNTFGRNLHIRFDCARRDLEAPLIGDPFTLGQWKTNFNPPAMLAPKQRAPLLACEFSIEDINNAQVHKVDLYFLAEVQYTDAFGASRITQMTRNILTDSAGGLRFGFVGRNCADNDCSPPYEETSMQTPLWQFFMDIGVKSVAALATILAVLVALFRERLQYRFDPPRLLIALKNERGLPMSLHTYDPNTNQAKASNGYWYHIEVKNNRRWAKATEVHIFLTTIKMPDGFGNFQSIWQGGHIPLGWRNEASQAGKTVGYPAECDLCHVLKDPLEVRLSPLVHGQIPEIIRGQFSMRLSLQARGIETKSEILDIDISWDGGWADDPIGMSNYLKIKECKRSA